MTKSDPRWERVQTDHDRETHRLQVPGGWLYLVTELGENGHGILKQHLVFVPRPQPERTER